MLTVRISASTHKVWDKYTVVIPQEIVLYQNNLYVLQGENGSGKSSFVRKILLPLLQKERTCPVYYFEQDIRNQYYAIKVHAMVKANLAVHTMSEAVQYMWNAIIHSLKEGNQAIIVFDETDFWLEWESLLSCVKSYPVIIVLISHQQSDNIPEICKRLSMNRIRFNEAEMVENETSTK